MINTKSTQGFTLIEVLVTLLILAVGLLGLAALQSTGLRYNQSAYLRSQASIYAYSIMDTMRANKDLAINGGYNIDFNSTPSSTNCVNTGSDPVCSDTALASYDLAQWKSVLVQNLPNGDGRITASTSAGSTIVTVEVRWSDDRDDPTSYTTMTFEGEL